MITFGDIFKSSFLENIASVSIFDMALALVLAFGLGMFIFLVYKRTFSGVMYSSSFGVTLVALTMITTVVILAVTSNVVLSLGMVGALSIVRFRNAVKNPLDLLYLFWSISAGIIAGVGLYTLVIVFSLTMTLLLFGLDRLPGTKAPELLVLRGPREGIDYDVLFDTLARYCRSYKEKARSTRSGETELIIEIRTKEKNPLLQALDNMKFLTQVNCISHDGECRS